MRWSGDWRQWRQRRWRWRVLRVTRTGGCLTIDGWLREERRKKELLELVGDVQRDERLSVKVLRLGEEEASLPDGPFESGSGKGVIQSYVDGWNGDVEEGMVELALVSALLLGSVAKQAGGKAYKHDFFLMHLNNAHLFTPLFLTTLPPSFHLPFLRALISQYLYYYICRGRPPLTPLNYSAQQSVLDWGTMFTEARANVDEHLPKAVRSPYMFEQRYADHQSKLQGMSGEGWSKEESVWRLTADQLVRMHTGQLQESKWEGKEAEEKGEPRGTHQEFWSFEPWF